MTRTTLRLGAVATTSWLAMGIALSGGHAAMAQTATSGDTVADVVVTGIRAALRSSADVKRNSVQVVDAVSAEDIGDFPDKNLGEALGRITGVQIDRADGEGRGVSIRGASPELNRVEINGATALSVNPGGGRQVDFRDLPVEFVNRLEVVKSQTADQTEGGLGGVVRVITRRPFDNGGRQYLAGSVQGVYSNLSDAWDPKVALIGSRTFLDGRLGVLVGVQAEKRHLDNNNARTTGWIRRARTATGPNAIDGRYTDINGDGTADWIPEIPRYSMDTRRTDRLALNSIVEFRANDDLTLFFDGNYAYGKEQVRSSFLQLGAASGLIDYAASTVGEDNTVDHLELFSGTSGGSAFNLDLAYRNINGNLHREQYTTAVGGRWTPGNWIIDARVNYSSAEVQNNEKNSTATITRLQRAVIDYTGTQKAPNITFPGLDPTTGQGITRLVALFNPRTNTQEEIVGKVDVEYRPADDLWITSIRGGIESRDLTMDSILYSRSLQLDTGVVAQSATTTSFQVPQSTITDIIDTYSVVNPRPFFSTGDRGFTGGVEFWNNNGDEVYDATIAAVAALGGPTTLDPYAAQYPQLPVTNVNHNLGTYQNWLDTWSVEEKVTSLYWQGSFAFDQLAVPFSGTIGTRYVDTDTLSTGYNRVVTRVPANGATPAYDLVSFPIGERAGGYSRWLPSANLRFDLIDTKLVGRITAGKVMARPNPNQLALRQSLDTVVGLSGTRGNPDLKPFEATQYDAALEYYFTRESFVSLTAFQKKISNFIVNVAAPEVIDGVTYSISRPQNGSERVTVSGLELGLQYAFRFLPAPFDGFGLQANLTKQKDEGYKGRDQITGELLPFPGLSRESYNLSLYYENERFSARTSYNYRSGWLLTANGRGGLPEFNEDIGYLDASFTYNVDDRFTVFLEGTNLTDEVVVQNNAPERRISNETFGSRYYIGLRAKF